MKSIIKLCSLVLLLGLFSASCFGQAKLPADLRSQLLAEQAAEPARIEPGLRTSEDGLTFTYGGSVKAPGNRTPYTARLGRDLSDGIEVTAAGSAYPVKLVPLSWEGGCGSIVETNLQYSVGADARVVYKFKGNGVKEDILIDRVRTDTVAFDFCIDMDPALEARLDGKGNLLIYGPDGVLAGFIQAGDDESAQRVLTARQNAPKNRLLYVIPAPVVFDGRGTRQIDKARYALNGTTLTLHASGLSGLPTPVTIDPSIVVTTTADFTSGNNEGMISFDTDAISREVPSGGGVSAWTTTTGFSTARSAHATVAHNGYLYVIGGWDGANTIGDVLFAPINPDGSIGAWAATSSLDPYPKDSHTCHAYNGYMYVICGKENGTPRQEIMYSAINADGTLAGWSTAGTFYSPRYNHTSVIYNGYLYIIGGRNSTQCFNDVYFAPIRANGTVGGFTATTGFTTARAEHASVAYNGYLYVLGGNDGTNLLNDIQYAPINADGSIGSWATTGWLGMIGREYHSVVAANGYLYILGGYLTGGAFTAAAQYAQINSNGTIGELAATESFTTARYDHTSVAYNGYLYVLGGYDGSVHNDVQYAAIDADPTLHQWGVTTDLPAPSYYHASYVYDNVVYVVGGLKSGAASGEILTAPISSSGGLGAWEADNRPLDFPRYHHSVAAEGGRAYVIGGNNGTSYLQSIERNYEIDDSYEDRPLPTRRSGQTSILYNGYLYVMGGYEGGTGTYLNEVLMAPIGDYGGLTIGPWTTTTPFATGRGWHTSSVYNGYLYVIGGIASGSVCLNDVQYAPINADGTLGAWTTASSFASPRHSHTSAAYNGYLYLAGGRDQSNYFNDVQMAVINLDGTIGPWTSSLSFPTPRCGHTSFAHNGSLYIIGGLDSGSSPLSDCKYSVANPKGTIGQWSTTTGFATPRSAHAAVSYNDYLYILGGGNDTERFNDVQYAQISASGAVGAWTTTSSFATQRSDHASVAHDGYIYIIGGNDGSTYLNDVQMAPLNADGTVGAWTTTTSCTTTGRSGHAALVYNGCLYVIGGRSDPYSYLSDVQYAHINPDGTVGSWSATTSILSGRSGHKAVAHNGFLYVLGGYDGEKQLGTVEAAPINANGTIGSWRRLNSYDRFACVESTEGAVELNGYLYVLTGCEFCFEYDPWNGGCKDWGYLSVFFQYAPLFSDGSIGMWERTTPYSTGRAAALTRSNAYLYLTGGGPMNYSGGEYSNYVRFAVINAPGARGRYSKLLDLGATRMVNSISFTGNANNGATNFTYALASASPWTFGTRTTIPDALSGTSYTTGLGTCGRYVWASFDLDDTDSVTMDNYGLNGRREVYDFHVSYTDIAATSVTATATAPNEITVSWGAVSGAASYNVYRRVADCTEWTHSFTLLASGVTDTSYVDGAVSGGTTYAYKIKAYMNAGCTSDYSDCADETALGDCYLVPTFAGLTSALNDEASGTCKIRLTWSAATSNCASGPGISYHIYRSTDPSFVPAAGNMIAQCVTATTYDDADVTYGTTYYYIVRSEDTTTAGGGPCNGGNVDANIARMGVTVGTVVLFSDGFENGMTNWLTVWDDTTSSPHTGSYCAYSGETARNCGLLSHPPPVGSAITIPSGAQNPVLRFWTRYTLKTTNGEAGIVQGSSNGTTWTKLTVSPAYPGTSNSSTNSCLGVNPQPAFTGISATWTEYTVDLSAYKGGNFRFRFNAATVDIVAVGTWHIDDVSVSYQTGCTVASHPGAVLDTLTLSKFQEDVTLSWTAPGGSCSVTGYGVYRGSLPMSGYDHASLSCAATGTTYTDVDPTGSYYYLVVPLNSSYEGLYGTDSSGTQRPQGTGSCHTQDITICN